MLIVLLSEKLSCNIQSASIFVTNYLCKIWRIISKSMGISTIANLDRNMNGAFFYVTSLKYLIRKFNAYNIVTTKLHCFWLVLLSLFGLNGYWMKYQMTKFLSFYTWEIFDVQILQTWYHRNIKNISITFCISFMLMMFCDDALEILFDIFPCYLHIIHIRHRNEL